MIIRKANPDERSAILKVMEPWNMHRVPSVEMEELDLNCFFVAVKNGQIIGASGFKIINPDQGKTTLLGVLPEFGGSGIGKLLQERRMKAMYDLGVKEIITNADRPATIRWYKKNFGYEQIGNLKKEASFGDDSIAHWTTLRTDLIQYMDRRKKNFKKAYTQKHQPFPLASYPPLIINACLTGMIPTKEMTEHVPISPEEIAEQAIQAFDAGARIVHLHARDEAGKPTWQAGIYEKIITSIKRERPKMICCVSTSGRNWPDLERRSEALYITGKGKPDMASLTLGSLNFPSGPSVNSIETVSQLARIMQENDILPELEVFDAGMISLAKVLETQGLLPTKKYFNLLLGSINSISAGAGDLDYLVSRLPENSTWAATGIGRFQLPINTAALVMGGNIRIGLEDNIYYDYHKQQLATNIQLIERVNRLARELFRKVASPEETRDILGL